ncbi:MAG: winged helix-turn-helix transcriptional regulator [Thermoplasmatota archaeon]
MVDKAGSPREQLVAAITGKPGAYFSQLQRMTGLAQGELAYHLRVLEEAEQVVSLTDAHYKHYFPRNAFPAQQKVVLSILTLPYPRELLLHIANEPGLSLAQLAERLGTTPPNVAWHLKRLARAGLVTRTKTGTRVTYSTGLDARLLATFLEHYHPTAWRVWSERLAVTISKIATKGPP